MRRRQQPLLDFPFQPIQGNDQKRPSLNCAIPQTPSPSLVSTHSRARQNHSSEIHGHQRSLRWQLNSHRAFESLFQRRIYDRRGVKWNLLIEIICERWSVWKGIRHQHSKTARRDYETMSSNLIVAPGQTSTRLGCNALETPGSSHLLSHESLIRARKFAETFAFIRNNVMFG
jgi:hypothetical protein